MPVFFFLFVLCITCFGYCLKQIVYTHFGDRETVFTYTGTAYVLIKVSCSEGKK